MRRKNGRLKDKVAIITGAGTGIGEAIAHKFAREGACVVVNGLPGDPVAEVASAIQDNGGVASYFEADIADEESAEACVEFAVEKYRKLDILVNNAGYFAGMVNTEEFPIDEFDRMMKANVRSVFLMTRFALPYLQRTKGNVVSAGSEAGFNGLPSFTPYGATKGAIHAFMKGVAVEQAQYGVRANCVCPGPVETSWTYSSTGPMDKMTERMTVNSTPLGRRATPEEIANVYAFIASDEASYVTGATWLVDGGITPAHGMMGAMARHAQAPRTTLPLQHSFDGLRNKPSAHPHVPQAYDSRRDVHERDRREFNLPVAVLSSLLIAGGLLSGLSKRGSFRMERTRTHTNGGGSPRTEPEITENFEATAS